MLIIPLIILLILYFMYCLLMRYESRTLWSGVGFFGLSMMTIITAFFYAFYYSETLTHYPLIMDIGVLLAATAVLVILFFPLATIIMFFVEGIKVIKHEGLKLTNLLSLIFAIGLFIFLSAIMALGTAFIIYQIVKNINKDDEERDFGY